MKLVLCPLKIELKFIAGYFQKLGYGCDSLQIGHYAGFIFPELKAVFAEGGHGKVQFGITTQKLISQIGEVDAIVCAGAAGALSDPVSIFDVVAATETFEHDYKEKFNTRATPPLIVGDERMLAKLKLFKNPQFKVHFGRVASGDEDITDPLRADELFSATSALAVAWEGIGGAKASRFNGVPYLEIRAITDNARHDVSENFAKNLPQAMTNLAKTIAHII